MSMATMVVAPTARAAMIAEHPTAPAPKEAKLVPGLTFSAFITAPASGLNTAAEWTKALERYVTADLDHVAFIGRCMSQKTIARKSDRELSRHGVECSSAVVQPRSTKAERERLLAMRHPSQATRLATSARQECEDHGITRRDFENIRSYTLNDSFAFVSKHDWLWQRIALVMHNHICVAQARGHDPDQDFVSARSFQS